LPYSSRSRTKGEERYKRLKSFDFTREKVGGAGRDRTGA
jgi:hypothetical protein